MLHLHYSNQLTELIAPLASVVHAEQTAEPLRRVTIIVPSQVVDEFPFLRRYLARVVEKADPGIRVLDGGGPQIAMFECLRQAADSREADFEAIRAYIAAASDKREHRELRLFELSRRLAWLFREYSILRHSMLARWPREPVLKDGRFRESELWQRRIYLSLFHDDGTLRAEWSTDKDSRWLMLPDAFRACDAERLREFLPAYLHVFGLSNSGPEFVRIFAALGELIDLHIYALNPCLEFWEDVQHMRLTARDTWSRRQDKIGDGLDVAEDPFGLASTDDNKALRLWGRAGREYIRLLNELTECDFDPHFAEPVNASGKVTLLARVQRNILLRQDESKGGEKLCDDASIRFLECPGARREVEIIANAIWSLMRRSGNSDSAAEWAARLRFHQIALLIPDTARELYLPHIESVFAQQHQIAVNVVDRRFMAESGVGEAVELLLKLPLGRFGRDELLHLLTHPAISGGMDVADPDTWSDWCRSLGVYFGADERATAGTYAPANLYHWDQALKRLSLGIFMAGEPSGEARAFQSRSEREYLPHEIAPDSMGAAAALVRFARVLLADAIELSSRTLTFEQWSRVLSNLIATYVHPPDQAGARVRDLIISAMDTLAPKEMRSTPVSYAIASDFALARIVDVEAEHGVYGESGVVVGSLSALRSIPFRVVFLLGLGESIFPERERRDLLDLRNARRHGGDVSPAERDRYMFLETILAAREQLFLSWVGRNAQTGEALEPSVVVRELQFILRFLLDEKELERLTIRHPVSSYDRRYFADLVARCNEGETELVSFDPNARRSARIVKLREDLDNRCGPLPSASRGQALIDALAPATRAQIAKILRLPDLPSRSTDMEMPEIVLPISALKSYLECPLQGAARYALGMVDEDDGGAEDSEHEPLVQPFLDRTILLREALWNGRGRPEAVARHYNDAHHAAELKGIAPIGLFAEAARQRDREKLAVAIAQTVKAGVASLAQWQQIAIGGAGEFVEVHRTLPAIVLDVNLRTPSGRSIDRIKLRGRIGPVSARLDCSIRLVAGRNARARDFLDGFFAAIVLAAANQKMPARFTAIAVGGDKDEEMQKFQRSFRPPPAREAREYLTMLARDLLCEVNDYFLPIEVVAQIKCKGAKTPEEIEEAIEGIRNNDRMSRRSDYGPVRDGRNFPAPEAPKVVEIIKRRFGLVEAIF
jgi:exodeoxyribonuclease V gamma subunit